VDALKIDRSFLAEDDQTDPAAMLRAITGLAHSLDLAVVAEGIERGDQWQLLCDVGVDLVQGFLIAPPVPASEASALFSRFICPAPPLSHV
jgi:FOG: EAL domain